ncbi:MAG: hypothetical protein KAT85_08460, partial [candidate division Zixibacteria bacterium]|nr:hypothetical protein [candidate division Zixibacteria bacterium]
MSYESSGQVVERSGFAYFGCLTVHKSGALRVNRNRRSSLDPEGLPSTLRSSGPKGRPDGSLT